MESLIDIAMVVALPLSTNDTNSGIVVHCESNKRSSLCESVGDFKYETLTIVKLAASSAALANIRECLSHCIGHSGRCSSYFDRFAVILANAGRCCVLAKKIVVSAVYQKKIT